MGIKGKAYIAGVFGHPTRKADDTSPAQLHPEAAADVAFECPFGPTVVNRYGTAAMRHMHEFGSTSAQLGWIKVAASHQAKHNPRALLREVVTGEDVVNSPMISHPLRRLDCCVI